MKYAFCIYLRQKLIILQLTKLIIKFSVDKYFLKKEIIEWEKLKISESFNAFSIFPG